MLSVVIVDDEYYFRQAVKKYLSLDNNKYHMVGDAKNGKEGMELIRSLRPDVVLIDINMPIMSGIEVIETIRKEKIECKIVILTGYGEFEYAKKCISLGVQDYLLKPVDSKSLYKCLEQIEAEVSLEHTKKLQYEQLLDNFTENRDIRLELLVKSIISANQNEDWRRIRKLSGEYPWLLMESTYLVLLIDIDFKEIEYWKEKDAPVYRDGIINIIVELAKNHDMYSLASDDGDSSLCVILSSTAGEGEMEDTVRGIVSELIKVVDQRMRLSILISVGRARASLRSCKRSYSEARMVQKYMLLYQKKGIFFYKEEQEQKSEMSTFLVQRAEQLLFLMRTKNEKGIESFLDGVFEEMKKEEIRPEYVFIRANDLISCALEFEREINTSGLESLPPDISTGSIDDIRLKIISFIRQIVLKNSEKIDGDQKALLGSIRQYLNENYQDSGLRLIDIAKNFGISKAILCQYFKETVKMTVGEYLQQVRLTSAKKMMDEGYYNITYIAEKCGYEDPGYFSKRFKAYFGIAPSAYLKKK